MTQFSTSALIKIIEGLCAQSGSQRAFARKIGVSNTAVQGWLSGVLPSMHNLTMIADSLGLQLDELLTAIEWIGPKDVPSKYGLSKALNGLSKDELKAIISESLELLVKK
jgi:transcriptional regulator with XRE-family HTH domain